MEEAELQIFGNQCRMEVWKRNFIFLEVWKQNVTFLTGSYPTDFHCQRWKIPLLIAILKKKKCEGHVWLKHMAFAMFVKRSVWHYRRTGYNWSGEWLSFRRFTSKLTWSWSWPYPMTLLQGQYSPSARCIDPLGSFVSRSSAVILYNVRILVMRQLIRSWLIRMEQTEKTIITVVATAKVTGFRIALPGWLWPRGLWPCA